MEVGKIYKVTHSRKGSFSLKVVAINDEWIEGVIYNGVAGAMMEYNVKLEGEEITVRESFLSNIEEIKA